MAGSAVGGLVGGLFGTIGGLVAGLEEKTLASRERRRFRKGMRRGEAETQREVYDILNSPEIQAARNFGLGTFGVGGGAGGGAGGTTFGGETFGGRPTGVALEGRAGKAANFLGKEFASIYNAQQELETGQRLSGGPLSKTVRARLEKKVASAPGRLKALENLNPSARRSAENMFSRFSGVSLNEGLARFQPRTATGTLEGGGAVPQGTGVVGPSVGGGPSYGPGFGFDSPLARDFRAGLAQAQTSRGLYSSNAAASAEASGLAALNFEQQKNLLPFMLGLGQLPSQLYQGTRGANINAQILKVSGGSQGFGVTPGNAPVAVLGRAAEGLASGAGTGAAIGASQQQASQSSDYLNYLKSQNNSGGGLGRGQII